MCYNMMSKNSSNIFTYSVTNETHNYVRLKNIYEPNTG